MSHSPSTRAQRPSASAPPKTAAPVIELDAAALTKLLGATDETSGEALAAWLSTHGREGFGTIARLAEQPSYFSAEASREVLAALTDRTLVDEETTLTLVHACLVPIAARIAESIAPAASGTVRGQRSVTESRDDVMVTTAVSTVTVSRRSKLAKGAVSCLATAGPGGALVLTRAFDAVRDETKLVILHTLDPDDVRALGANVIASMASSVVRLATSLKGRQRDDANAFLVALGPVDEQQSAPIDPEETLDVGLLVFHAAWGAGMVTGSDHESVTVDFGTARQRTLLRAYATLRHAD